jgi:hypothetical protein
LKCKNLIGTNREFDSKRNERGLDKEETMNRQFEQFEASELIEGTILKRNGFDSREL